MNRTSKASVNFVSKINGNEFNTYQRTFIKFSYPLDIHSGTHSQSMSWCLVVGWVAPAKLCETKTN